MKNKKISWFICIIFIFSACIQNKNNIIKQENMSYNELTPEEEAIILHKGTERPYTGEYNNNRRSGTYICKRCNAPLYTSKDKFDSQCGWPSFDDEINGAIEKVPDSDGIRTEIICAKCKGHLGHVFYNEGFTLKGVRHCVNSISLKFVPDNSTRKAYFASGCFWGTEYYFMKAEGVEHTAVGFMGGHVDNPSYEEVCQKNTGHLETVEVEFDESKTSYENMLKLFFETHDFTQTNGQGPDIGPQYLSCIFYNDDEEKAIAEQCIEELTQRGYQVATMVKPSVTFWEAEDYHQQYYEGNGKRPYCHKYTKIF